MNEALKDQDTGRQRSFLARVLIRLVKLVLLFALIPGLLVPLYAVLSPPSTLMLRNWAMGAPVERIWRPLEQISPHVIASVVMSEDGQFCRHHGVDLGALRVVTLQALEGKRPRGASTIPMQVARNLFLWHGRSYVRKGLEIPLALYLDLVLSKRRILEIYLNIAEWGPSGQFGIEAGSRRHFRRPAARLSAEQAALMAVTLPNPHKRNPLRAGPRMRKHAGIIAKRAKGAKRWLGCLGAVEPVKPVPGLSLPLPPAKPR